MQLNLIDSFREFKDFKNFDKETMMAILEDVFRNMIIKKFGSDENFDLIINPEKGDLEIWRNREIVANDAVEDSNEQISLEDALKIEADFEVGEEVSEEIGKDKHMHELDLFLKTQSMQYSKYTMRLRK